MGGMRTFAAACMKGYIVPVQISVEKNLPFVARPPLSGRTQAHDTSAEHGTQKKLLTARR
jgi:hypothetical protein